MSLTVQERQVGDPIKKSRVVGRYNCLTRPDRGLVDLTDALSQTVEREAVGEKLTYHGLSQVGLFITNHIPVGRPVEWSIYEGAALIPDFPRGEFPVSAVVAVSNGTKEEPESKRGYVFGRFAGEPIPSQQFLNDLQIAYDRLVYNPGLSRAERISDDISAGGCLISLLGISAGTVAVLFTENSAAGVSALGVGAALSSGLVYLGNKVSNIREARQAAVLAAISQPDQYFTGQAVGEKLDYLRDRSVNTMFNRAVYQLVQEELGPIERRKFKANYNYQVPALSQEAKLQLIEAYGKCRDGEMNEQELPPFFTGFVEVVRGLQRMDLMGSNADLAARYRARYSTGF